MLACETWNHNGDLVQEAGRLYIKPKDWVLDTTPGRGVWNKKLKHRRLVSLLPGDDFRALPYEDGTFDVVWYDPPYVSTGGRASSGLQEFLDRFGLYDAPPSPKLLQELCNTGARECWRVLKKDGLLFWKTKEYTSSGRLFSGLMLSYYFGVNVMGMRYQDHFIMHRKSPMPQPPRTRRDGTPSVQQHARRNCSHLLVLKRIRQPDPF